MEWPSGGLMVGQRIDCGDVGCVATMARLIAVVDFGPVL